jgi:hypothetical protein
MSILFFLVPVLVASGVVLWLLAKGRRERQRSTMTHQLIQALSSEAARQQALALLTSTHGFVVIELPPTDIAALEFCAPMLREFFHRFEFVSTTRGDFTVSRSQFCPSQLAPGLVRIGEALPGTELECELAAKPGEEAIFEVEQDRVDTSSSRHRTIYHLIVSYSPES